MAYQVIEIGGISDKESRTILPSFNPIVALNTVAREEVDARMIKDVCRDWQSWIKIKLSRLKSLYQHIPIVVTNFVGARIATELREKHVG